MNEILSNWDFSVWSKPLQLIAASLPRFLAVFATMPLFAGAVVPRTVRAGCALTLALVAYPAFPVASLDAEFHFFLWIAFLLKEILIGSMVGYATGMVIWIFMAVGELIDLQIGFNNAQLFDPFGGHSQGPMSILMGQIGIMFFLGFGGLHVLMQLLYESIILWPPGSFTPGTGVAFKDFSIRESGSLLELSARFAAPVIGALLLIEVGIGLLNRVAPQLHTFYFSMPLKAIVGLLVTTLFLSHLADVTRLHMGGLKYLLIDLNRILFDL